MKDRAYVAFLTGVGLALIGGGVGVLGVMTQLVKLVEAARVLCVAGLVASAMAVVFIVRDGSGR